MLKVYYLKVSDYIGFSDEFFYPYIGESTCAAISAYKNERVLRTKLLGEGMIRKLLESFWGVKRGDYQIIKGLHGKPYVRGGGQPVFFNISHSGDYVLCVFSEAEVGVDIERKGIARIGVARRFFHPEETRMLECLSGDERDDLFFRYWSVKESFLKYDGGGLSASLSDFQVRFETDGIKIDRENVRLPLFVHECLIDSDYKCYVCTKNLELPELIHWKF